MAGGALALLTLSFLTCMAGRRAPAPRPTNPSTDRCIVSVSKVNSG